MFIAIIHMINKLQVWFQLVKWGQQLRLLGKEADDPSEVINSRKEVEIEINELELQSGSSLEAPRYDPSSDKLLIKPFTHRNNFHCCYSISILYSDSIQ